MIRDLLSYLQHEFPVARVGKVDAARTIDHHNEVNTTTCNNTGIYHIQYDTIRYDTIQYNTNLLKINNRYEDLLSFGMTIMMSIGIAIL